MRPTEKRHPGTVGLDGLATDALVERLVALHSDVPQIVGHAAAGTVAAVDAAARRLVAGGRLTYIASGTPGWLADADAAELPPTFGARPDQLVVVRSRSARETPEDPDEDRPERGAARVAALGLGAGDLAVAIAASGSTPFTLGAAQEARDRGALLVAVLNVPDAPLAAMAEVSVMLETGAEPIMGSTRMRAGLSQRLWLTVFSTAVMVRLGRTHDNLMVNVAPVLVKLRERRVTIAAEATGLERCVAMQLLDAAGDDLRVAIVMDLAGVSADVARGAIEASGGRTRAAITAAQAR